MCANYEKRRPAGGGGGGGPLEDTDVGLNSAAACSIRMLVPIGAEAFPGDFRGRPQAKYKRESLVPKLDCIQTWNVPWF